MANFMEDLAYQQTPEYKLQKKIEGVNSRIDKILYFLRTEIKNHYNAHKIEGYLYAFNWDGLDLWLEPKPKKYNQDMYMIGLSTADLFKEKFTEKLIELGINQFVVECPIFDVYDTKHGIIRDEVHYKTGEQFCGLYLSISW